MPIPTTDAAFGAMPRYAPVVVAHLPLSTPAPPQPEPVRVRAPDAESCAQLVPEPASAPNVGKPFASIESAATVEVVKVLGEEVAR